MEDSFPIRLGSTSPALRYELPPWVDAARVQSLRFNMPPLVNNAQAVLVPETPAKAEYQWAAGDLSMIGTFPGWFVVAYDDGTTEIAPRHAVIPVRVG